jgi:energy-coupling factor transporter ATP-binding protein EcfA2
LKETLHIKNFGPIKEVKLELGKVNVLIGDQGTGKSTVAKLLHILYTTSIDTDEADLAQIIGSDDQMTDRTSVFLRRLKQNGLSKYMRGDSYIEFNRPQAGTFFYNRNDAQATYHYLNDDPISDIHHSNSVYIPAERMFIAAVFENIFALNQLDIVLPEYFNKYAQLLNRISTEYSELDFSKILGVKYKFVDGKIKILRNDSNVFLDIKESSSGVQTLMPIYLYLHHLLQIKGIDEKGRFLLSIEELEMNSFPHVQNETVKKIIEANYYQTKNNTLLTTHSPYILTSLNNLMYAYTVGQNHKEKVSTLIPQEYWLNPDEVSAYMLVYDEKEGGCVEMNIIDEETKLIDSIRIDGVSDMLSDEFNKIMEIGLAE